MIERKIIARNCFYNDGSGLKELAIGTVIKTENPDLFGEKAVTVGGGELEVATPKPRAKSRRSKED